VAILVVSRRQDVGHILIPRLRDSLVLILFNNNGSVFLLLILLRFSLRFFLLFLNNIINLLITLFVLGNNLSFFLTSDRVLNVDDFRLVVDLNNDFGFYLIDDHSRQVVLDFDDFDFGDISNWFCWVDHQCVGIVILVVHNPSFWLLSSARCVNNSYLIRFH